MPLKISKIKRVTPVGVAAPYDISVEGVKNYLSQGFVNHNSSGPNCQNFPAFVRGQCIPRPGYRFVEWDLSQAEIRAVAALSGDKELMAALDAEDIHAATASRMFGVPPNEVRKEQRKAAKTIVFGILYGMSAFRLALALKISVEEAEMFIDRFLGAFPQLKHWLDLQPKLARKPPYYAYTPWGTRRSTRNMLSTDNSVRSHTARVSCNMPVQGAAGELTLYYICEQMDRFRALGLDIHLVNTTHDSVTYEVAEHLIEFDSKGDLSGIVAQIINEVIATPAPVKPLNTVQFKADIEVTDAWSGTPNLLRAIDPQYDKDDSKYLWSVIGDGLDEEEEEAIADAEEAYYAMR